jgi:hypothetical protein
MYGIQDLVFDPGILCLEIKERYGNACGNRCNRSFELCDQIGSHVKASPFMKLAARIA